MKAFVFPGQGGTIVGMGKDLYESSALAKELFEKANDILGYRITDIMFEGLMKIFVRQKLLNRQFSFILSSLHYAKTMIQNLK